MAYETGSATDIQDLLDELRSFATTNGWTEDRWDATNNVLSLHRNDVYVHFTWQDAVNQLAMYQSLGYISAGTNPWAHTDDSGNGDTSYPINVARRVNFESLGPFTAFHFFASTTAPYYIHIAVEVDSGRFRHFGFGELDKVGDWEGGEYCYGHYWSQLSSDIDVGDDPQHSFGLDGLTAQTDHATMHIEGMSFMDANTKWGNFSSTTGSPGTDTAGEVRIPLFGSSRSGLWTYALSWMRTSVLNAYKPLIPINVLYRLATTTPDVVMILGTQPDVAIVGLGSLSPGDELTVGGDTWLVFPWVRKQNLGVDTEESENAGIAYKKIT